MSLIILPRHSYYKSVTAPTGSCEGLKMAVRSVLTERMWGAYHKLHTSEIFKTKWEALLKVAAITEPCPISYQYATDQLFKGMIVQHFPVAAEASNETDAKKCDDFLPGMYCVILLDTSQEHCTRSWSMVPILERRADSMPVRDDRREY